MATRDGYSFGRMLRTFPFRTTLFTFGPILFGLAQLANAFAHGGSVALSATFLALLVGFSVLVTRYHMATFRLNELTGT